MLFRDDHKHPKRRAGWLSGVAIVLFLLLHVSDSGAQNVEQSIEYTYDAQGRLTSATYDNAMAIRYTYDANNNITSRVIEPAGPTAIDEIPGLPTSFALHPNYPNPFNPSTQLSYDVKDAVVVKLKVYDVLGRLVATVLNEFRTPGRYQQVFDARALSSGIYFYEITMGDFQAVKSMLLLK